MKSLDRGVKQAGFLVLYKTTMPAILIENGFVSNLKEEELLSSEKGKNEIAHSIFDAFKEYKFKMEGFNNQAQIATLKVEDEKPNTTKPNDKPDTLNLSNVSKNEISFRVQFATSATDKSTSSSEFLNLEKVKKYFHGNLFKFRRKSGK